MAVRTMTSRNVSDRPTVRLVHQLTGVFAILSEELADLVANLAVRELDIVLGGTIVRHEGEETVVGNIELCIHISTCFFSPCACLASGRTYELVLLAADVGNVHVMGGRAKFLELLAGEDIDGNQMDLGVTVLAGLGGRHVDDLAGTVLDANEAVLPQGRTLHGVGERGAGIGALEGVLML